MNLKFNQVEIYVKINKKKKKKLASKFKIKLLQKIYILKSEFKKFGTFMSSVAIQAPSQLNCLKRVTFSTNGFIIL